MLLWNHPDDFDGEVVADVDDSARENMVLGSKGFFKSVDLSSKLANGGRGEGLGIGLHGVHVEEELFRGRY